MFTRVNISCRALLKIFLYLRESSPSKSGILYGLIKTPEEVEIREYMPIPNNIANHQELMGSDYYTQLTSVFLSAGSGMIPVGYLTSFEHFGLIKENFAKPNDIILSFVHSATNFGDALRCFSFEPSIHEIPIHISMKTLDTLLVLNNHDIHVESPTALGDRMKRHMQDYSVCMNFFINFLQKQSPTRTRALYVSALNLIKASASASVPVSFK